MEDDLLPRNGFCKLASRIRREIANFLPQTFGVAMERLRPVRRRLRKKMVKGKKRMKTTETQPPENRLSINCCPSLRRA